jgi:DNA-nicking Smr family endonuclease
VHALLQRSPHVQTYCLGDAHAGSWGATVVTLRR